MPLGKISSKETVNIMRKVLTFCIILFIILAAVPITASYISMPKNDYEPVKPAKSEDSVISYAVSISDESFCDEGLKCALAIAENNCLLSESAAQSECSEDFYARVEKLYEDVDVTLLYEGESVYIPTSSLSAGRTATNTAYPYMKAVASPWDCLSEDFVYDKEYNCGVSMNGLNYLCENGMDYKEALRWYLPEFTIK